MNYDRLLTRVFDKQEKKMIYQGDGIGEGTEFYGIYQDNIIIKEVYMIEYDCFSLCEMGDRFVPMMCYGKRDKNDKPLYDNDILQEKTGHTYCLEFDGTEWMVRYIKYNVEYKGQKMPAPYTPWGCMWGGTDKIDDEIIGNKWENSEILEANE